VLLPASGMVQVATDWSTDGQYVLYEERNPNTNWDVWVLPLSGSTRPFAFAATPSYEGQARFSPDGKWIAFVSDESGSREICVQPFQRSGEKRRISIVGGSSPVWRKYGKELFLKTNQSSSIRTRSQMLWARGICGKNGLL
jgi:Tol biopolymer transport system component